MAAHFDDGLDGSSLPWAHNAGSQQPGTTVMGDTMLQHDNYKQSTPVVGGASQHDHYKHSNADVHLALPAGGVSPSTSILDDPWFGDNPVFGPNNSTSGIIPVVNKYADVRLSNASDVQGGDTTRPLTLDGAYALLHQADEHLAAVRHEHEEQLQLASEQMDLMELESRQLTAALTARNAELQRDVQRYRTEADLMRETMLQHQANNAAEMQLLRREIAEVRGIAPSPFSASPAQASPPPAPSPIAMRGSPPVGQRDGTPLASMDVTLASLTLESNRMSLLVAPAVRLPPQPAGVQSLVIAQPPFQPKLKLDYMDPLRAGDRDKHTLPMDPRPSLKSYFDFVIALHTYRSNGGTVAVRALWPPEFQTYLQSKWEGLSTPMADQLKDDEILLLAARRHLRPHAGAAALDLLKALSMSKQLSRPDGTALTRYVEDFRMHLDLFQDMPEDQQVAPSTVRATFIAGLHPAQFRQYVDTWYKGGGKSKSFDDVVREARRCTDDFESKALSVLTFSSPGAGGTTKAPTATPTATATCLFPGCTKPVGVSATTGTVFAACSQDHQIRAQELRRNEARRHQEAADRKALERARVLQAQPTPMCASPGCSKPAQIRTTPNPFLPGVTHYNFCSYECSQCPLCKKRGHVRDKCPAYHPNGAVKNAAPGAGGAAPGAGGGGWGRGGRGGRSPHPGDKPPGARPPPRVMTCYRCGGEGHRSRDCSATPMPREQQIAKSNLFLARAMAPGISDAERRAMADDLEDVMAVLSAESTPQKAPAPATAASLSPPEPDTRLMHVMMQQLGELKGEIRHLRENM